MIPVYFLVTLAQYTAHFHVAKVERCCFSVVLQGMNPADYLDVDSPAQRGKKTKKRRKVERNTKLSRSLDSLKELHGKKKSQCFFLPTTYPCYCRTSCFCYVLCNFGNSYKFSFLLRFLIHNFCALLLSIIQ